MKDAGRISEDETRKRLIDKLLRQAGWTNIAKFEEGKKYDFAVLKEHPTENGPADYILFNNGRAIAAVEAKKLTLGPQNVLVQAERYSKGYSGGNFDFNGHHLPFVYSTNGEAIWFRDLRIKNSRSYMIASFHTPTALEEKLSMSSENFESWIEENPIDESYLRPYQCKAIEAVEDYVASGKRKMLLAMATGTGKTVVASAMMYRLLKSGTARRILFLVDRRALAAQAVSTLASFMPEPGVKFDKIYEVYSQPFRSTDVEDYKFDPKVLPNNYLDQYVR